MAQCGAAVCTLGDRDRDTGRDRHSVTNACRAYGHMVNHPGPGMQPNVLEVSVNLTVNLKQVRVGQGDKGGVKTVKI